MIRTSDEIRMSGCLLWQSAHSEFYFFEINWPEFRKTGFLLTAMVAPVAAMRQDGGQQSQGQLSRAACGFLACSASREPVAIFSFPKKLE